MKALLAGALVVAIASCGPSVDGNAELRLDPPTATLHVQNRTPASLAYTVLLVEDGVATDVTDRAIVSLPSQFGRVEGNVVVASGNALGPTEVSALLGDETATANLTITGDERRIDPALPADIGDRFDQATLDSARDLRVLYPPNNAAVPRNLGDLDVHWQAAGDDAFEVSLRNEHATLRVYVPASNPAHWMRFLPEEWSRVVGASPKVDVLVRGLNLASPGTYSQSSVTQLKTSDQAMEGGIYYWATKTPDGSDGGLWRHDMQQAGAQAESYLSAGEAGQCIGCHSLSRSGEKMIVKYINGTSGLFDVATKTAIPIPTPGAVHDLWAYHPSGSVMLQTVGTAAHLCDGVTAMHRSTIPDFGLVTHPDFSPAGDKLVYLEPGADNVDRHHVAHVPGRIVVRTFDVATNTFGPPTPVLSTGDLIYYPVVSPDGQWVAYNRAPSGESVSNPLGEVWVVKLDGTKAVRLANANVGPGNANSWGRWAPFEQTIAGETFYWLTFSSTRSWGVFNQSAAPQLWMTGFSPSRAEAGSDPSTPAIRLPFQSREIGNHIGQWTMRVVPVD